MFNNVKVRTFLVILNTKKSFFEFVLCFKEIEIFKNRYIRD